MGYLGKRGEKDSKKATVLTHEGMDSIFKVLKDSAYHTIGIIFRDISYKIKEFGLPVRVFEINSLRRVFYFEMEGLTVRLAIHDEICSCEEDECEDDECGYGGALLAEFESHTFLERVVDIRISDLRNRRFVTGHIKVCYSVEDGTEEDITVSETSVGDDALLYLYHLSRILDKRR